MVKDGHAMIIMMRITTMVMIMIRFDCSAEPGFKILSGGGWVVKDDNYDDNKNCDDEDDQDGDDHDKALGAAQSLG